MRIVSGKLIEKIREMKKRYESDKIIIQSGKNDKNKTITSLMEDLDYLYTKLT